MIDKEAARFAISIALCVFIAGLLGLLVVYYLTVWWP